MDSMLNDSGFHEDFVDDILKEAVFEEELTQEHIAPSVHGEVAPEEENEPDRGSPVQTTTCVTCDAEREYRSRAPNQCVL